METVREAREVYFKESGFNEATYSDRWVKLPLGPLKFYLPNIAARKKAVPLHDIDHVLTGYKTDWRGELVIAAFEIGTGCGKYWAGWMINLQGIVMGGVLFPLASIQAYARGLRSRGVYHYQDYRELLDQPVEPLRAELIAPERSATPIDALLFCAWWLTALVVNFGPLVALYFVLFGG